MPKANKANNATYTARVNVIYKLLLDGYSRAELLHFVAMNDVKNPDKAWNLTERQIDNMIAVANRKFEQESKFNRRRELGKSLRRLENLYQQNMRVQDYKGALSAERARIELLNLTATEPSQPAPSVATLADVLLVVAQAIGEAQAMPTTPAKAGAMARLAQAAGNAIKESDLEQRFATLEELVNRNRK